MQPIASIIPSLPIKLQRLSYESDGQYLAELYNDPGGLGWYVLAVRQLGRHLVGQLVSMSKTGRDPKRLFTYLARRAIRDKAAAATKYQ